MDSVTFLKVHPKGHMFQCRQKNSQICYAQVSKEDLMNPPPAGSQLVIKHSGFSEKSQKLRFPFLLEIKVSSKDSKVLFTALGTKNNYCK